MAAEYKAHLVVRDDRGAEVHRVGLRRIDHRYVEKVMRGMLINMSDDYYIDDSEVDAARKVLKGENDDRGN